MSDENKIVREHSEELGELFTALSAAQAEFTAIPKDATNPFFNSKYAPLPTVVEKASPILTKQGLSVCQFPGVDSEGNDTLTTWLGHKSGQWIRESMRLHPVKTDPQSHGSAITYARRQSYMAALGLVTDEDDDGAAASRRAEGTVSRGSNSNGRSVTAAPAQATERIATAKQRGLINARASEKGLPPTTVANILLVAAEQPTRDFESQSHAESFINRQLDRLPARLVDPLLKGIDEAAPEEVPA